MSGIPRAGHRPPMSAAAMRAWRIAFVVLGVAGLALGGVALLDQVNPSRYLGILAWFIGALIIHDGIIAFGVLGVSLVLRRVGRRVPVAVLAILQGAIVVGAIVALVVFPQIYKQGVGTLNPTVLPLDYAGNLIVFYVVLAALTAAVIAGYLAVRARRARAAAK